MVYSAHTPFLEAAVYAKQRDPRIRICLYVPDLPNYMNLNADCSAIYDIAKSFDIRKMKTLMRTVDSFVLLTRHMQTALPVGHKPCLIAEGILPVQGITAPVSRPSGEYRDIVYTGKLNEKFGILHLLDAFRQIPDPRCRLVLCGRGDCDDAAAQAARTDPRILLTGQITPEEARSWQQNAAVLVNPRPNNEEYTKYSFPSKTIEYLMTSNPVAAFLLDGIPSLYKDFLCPIRDDVPPSQAIAQALQQTLDLSEAEQQEKYHAFGAYARETLRPDRLAERIIAMNFDNGDF